jgi:hypothetical protein
MATLSQADVEAIVDAFVAAILKHNPIHPQTPAQTHPAGDVLKSVDAFGRHACASVNAKDIFVDNYRPAEDIVTSVNTFGKHAAVTC